MSQMGSFVPDPMGSPDPMPDGERLDALVSRIVDGVASESEWREFSGAADRSPALWRDLARAQRDHGALSATVQTVAAIADRVPLAGTGGARQGSPRVSSHRVAWLGWAAAAGIAIAWTGNLGAPSGGTGVQSAGVPFGGDADQAAQAYLDLGRQSGRVVGELPERILVESRPIVVSAADEAAFEGMGMAPGGPRRAFEVVYIRQFVERRIVPTVYRAGQREDGTLVPVPAEAPVFVSPGWRSE